MTEFARLDPREVRARIARTPLADAPKRPARLLITLPDQCDRCTADGPPKRPVLSRRHFDERGEACLDSGPRRRLRHPPAVNARSGAFQDIFDACAGTISCDPRRSSAPVAVIRGERDSLCTDADPAWLLDTIPNSDIRLRRATHLMHLAQNRYALHRSTEAFLTAQED